jgi:hypothetical protein
MIYADVLRHLCVCHATRHLALRTSTNRTVTRRNALRCCPTIISFCCFDATGKRRFHCFPTKYMNRGFSARSSNSAAICGTNTLRTMRTASTEDAAHRGRQGRLLPVG